MKQEEMWLHSWKMVEQGGRWPQQACTTMFFLIPKNVTSERPFALMPTLVGSSGGREMAIQMSYGV